MKNKKAARKETYKRYIRDVQKIRRHPKGFPSPYFEGSKLEVLPPISQRLYKKLSEAYGIPVSEMTPKIERNKKMSWLGGVYYPDDHQVVTYLSENKGTFEHEILHSIQGLLMPKPFQNSYQNKFIKEHGKPRHKLKMKINKLITRHKFNRFVETTASHHLKGMQFYEKSMISFSDVDLFTNISLLVSSYAYFSPKNPMPLVLLAKIGIDTAKNIRIFNKLHSFLGKYGQESLLLLFAHPPKNLNLMLLPKLEQQFLKQGFISPKVGLTKTGMRHIMHQIPRSEIIRRLQKTKN